LKIPSKTCCFSSLFLDNVSRYFLAIYTYHIFSILNGVKDWKKTSHLYFHNHLLWEFFAKIAKQGQTPNYTSFNGLWCFQYELGKKTNKTFCKYSWYSRKRKSCFFYTPLILHVKINICNCVYVWNTNPHSWTYFIHWNLHIFDHRSNNILSTFEAWEKNSKTLLKKLFLEVTHNLFRFWILSKLSLGLRGKFHLHQNKSWLQNTFD